MAKTTLFYYSRNNVAANTGFVGLGSLTEVETPTTTEAKAQAVIGAAGTLSDLWGRFSSGGAGRAATVRLNGSDTSITIAPTGSGEFTDVSNTASVTANDKLAIGFTGGTQDLRAVSAVFNATTNTVFLLNGLEAGGDNLANIDFQLMNSTLPASNTAVPQAHLLRSAGTVVRTYVYVNTNAATGNGTATISINASDSGQSVTITALSTGLFEDTGAAAAYSAGDTIQMHFDEGSGGNTNYETYGTTCISTNSKQDSIGRLNAARTGSATVHFWPISGEEGATGGTEANVKISMQYDGTASNLRIHAPSNSMDADGTFTLRKNGVDTAVTLTHTAGSTSLIEDTTNTVTFVAGDDLSLSYDGGTSGTIGESTTWALTLEADAGGGDDLLADDLSTPAPTLSSPAVGQKHVLLADDLSTPAPTLSNPALDAINLLAEDLTTPAPTLSSPSIGQEHGLLADDLATPAPTLTSASLGQSHVLLADDLATGAPTLSSPVLAHIYNLTGDDLSTPAPTLTTPAVGQEHALLADDLTTPAPTLTNATLGQEHVLLADDLATPAPTLSNPQIKQTLFADDLATPAPTLTTPALGQEHVLLADDLTVPVPTLTVPAIGQEHVLLADDLATGTPTLSNSFFVNTHDSRTLVLPEETRTLKLPQELRTLTLPLETRTLKL